MTYALIAQKLGISMASVYKSWKLYENGGYPAIIIKKRGVKAGTNSKLNPEQTEMLKETLIEKTPDQLGLTYNLWTRQTIQILVYRMWKIFMPIRTVGRYMKRLGFTPQRPIKQAYQQNPKAVYKWLKIDYPGIAKKAKLDRAEIHWIDETGIRSDIHYGRSYSPKGKTPVIRVDARRTSVNIVSSITNRGKIRFMTYCNTMNTKKLIKFVGRLLKDAKRKILIILDNLAVHHSKAFKLWIKKRENKIEAFYLPSYSPELNPDERLNRDLKTNFHSAYTSGTKDLFRKKIISFLKNLQRNPKRVISYFKNSCVRYAA
ncbi:MAG: IS630 family transposase [Desulfobacterales bacterium]|nr:IS630 family transposase [Desulfobacterales bacterium]